MEESTHEYTCLSWQVLGMIMVVTCSPPLQSVVYAYSRCTIEPEEVQLMVLDPRPAGSAEVTGLMSSHFPVGLKCALPTW